MATFKINGFEIKTECEMFFNHFRCFAYGIGTVIPISELTFNSIEDDDNDVNKELVYRLLSKKVMER